MSLKRTFIIPEAPGAPNRLTGQAKPRVTRMLERGLQEADAALAAGKKDVATTRLRYLATEIDSYLLNLANDVSGGSLK